jgi:hypothetical protein
MKIYIVGKLGKPWDVCVSAMDADEPILKAKKLGQRFSNCANEIEGIVKTDRILV